MAGDPKVEALYGVGALAHPLVGHERVVGGQEVVVHDRRARVEGVDDPVGVDCAHQQRGASVSKVARQSAGRGVCRAPSDANKNSRPAAGAWWR